MKKEMETDNICNQETDDSKNRAGHETLRTKMKNKSYPNRIFQNVQKLRIPIFHHSSSVL